MAFVSSRVVASPGQTEVLRHPLLDLDALSVVFPSEAANLHLLESALCVVRYTCGCVLLEKRVHLLVGSEGWCSAVELQDGLLQEFLTGQGLTSVAYHLWLHVVLPIGLLHYRGIVLLRAWRLLDCEAAMVCDKYDAAVLVGVRAP